MLVDADNGTGGVDAASVFTVEEGARASVSTGEITDLSIESGFTQRRHLLANPWLAQNILFENINEFAATTSTATAPASRGLPFLERFRMDHHWRTQLR